MVGLDGWSNVPCKARTKMEKRQGEFVRHVIPLLEVFGGSSSSGGGGGGGGGCGLVKMEGEGKHLTFCEICSDTQGDAAPKGTCLLVYG